MNRLSSVATLALLASSSLAHANACPPKSTTDIQTTVENWVNANQPGVAYGLCAVALDGVNHVEGFACSGKADAVHGLTKDTIFQIGSVTKTLTATMFAKRVAEGTLSLTQKLDPLLPLQFRLGSKDTITLLQLADHHSRLPDEPLTFNQEIGDFLDLGTYISNDELLAPGYHYSNFGFQILGYTIAEHDNLTYLDDLFDSVLFLLDMGDTKTFEQWLSDDHSFFTVHAATRHDDTFADLGSGPASTCPTADPSGCLYATSHDMRIWLQYAMGTVTPPGSYGDARALLRKSYDTGHYAGESQGLAWSFVDTDDATGGFPNACDPLPAAEQTATKKYYTRVAKSGDVSGSHAYIQFLQDPHHPNAIAPLGVVLMVNSDLKQGKKLNLMADDLLARLKLTQP